MARVYDLRLQDLEEASFWLRIQGLHEAKALAGRDILLVVPSEGENALADDHFEMSHSIEFSGEAFQQANASLPR
jgi:hypothetical protein